LKIYEEDVEDPYVVLRDYLESLALFTNTDSIEDEDKVLLMTLHNAKGLEFPYVCIHDRDGGKHIP